MPESKKPQVSTDVISQVAERVDSCDNVLVALSKDPSVDELSAALGLTFALDKLGKHATAIFSGAVPNAIEFLEPEKTFETNTNSLQDFIIALDKEKADHLRYKIDGDYVKVFITPYKTTIDEKDLEFSHGDYNVDLVIALNVESAADLDGALSEYGRIMHDATSVNIHAGEPGRFSELEWGDPKASSVSEMVCNLIDRLTIPKDKSAYDKSVATALLAGIVAATNRFSNEHTSADTMAVASRLMAAGADQQLISSSIPVDILTSGVVDANPEATAAEESTEASTADAPEAAEESAEPADPTTLAIQHGAIDFEPPASASTSEASTEAAPAPETPEATSEATASTSDQERVDAMSQLDAIVSAPSPESAGPLMDELKNAVINEGKKNLVPPSEAGAAAQPPKDYAAMMSAELAAPEPPMAAPQTPTAVPQAPIAAPQPPEAAPLPDNNVPTDLQPVNFASEAEAAPQQAAVSAPAPEVPAPAPAEAVPAGVPTPESMMTSAELADNPLPMPDPNTVLPPPPMPFDPSAGQAPAPMPAPAVQGTAPAAPAPVGVDAVMPGVIQPAGEISAANSEANSSYLGSNPAMQDQLYPDPNSFHIPGM